MSAACARQNPSAWSRYGVSAAATALHAHPAVSARVKVHVLSNSDHTGDERERQGVSALRLDKVVEGTGMSSQHAAKTRSWCWMTASSRRQRALDS